MHMQVPPAVVAAVLPMGSGIGRAGLGAKRADLSWQVPTAWMWQLQAGFKAPHEVMITHITLMQPRLCTLHNFACPGACTACAHHGGHPCKAPLTSFDNRRLRTARGHVCNAVHVVIATVLLPAASMVAALF